MSDDKINEVTSLPEWMTVTDFVVLKHDVSDPYSHQDIFAWIYGDDRAILQFVAIEGVKQVELSGDAVRLLAERMRR